MNSRRVLRMARLGAAVSGSCGRRADISFLGCAVGISLANSGQEYEYVLECVQAV
jgi:hypothetical protein